ncbi:MAG: PEP-CTERM sorting domain-containing protein [Aliiglaciecola sp.]|uniref:PEP-CTERM sorting domain-containing protein n=1 Tax=Aliiglaciecola sp. TaxID=1872441 RepID=UPI00329703F5
MKRILTPMLTALVLLCSASASASIISLPTDGLISDSVVGDSGWLNEDTFGDAIDFITFDVAAQSTFTATTDSLITMGLSLYQGTIGYDFAIPFSNNSDFSDFFDNLVFVDGNSPYVPGLGGSLTGLVLEAGSYTLAVGGNEGFFDTFTDYAYDLEVAIAEVQQVPEPSALFLLFFGIAGLLAARKQQTK